MNNSNSKKLQCSVCGKELDNWEDSKLVGDLFVHVACYNGEYGTSDRVLPILLSDWAYEDICRAKDMTGYSTVYDFVIDTLYEMCQIIFSSEPKETVKKRIGELIGIKEVGNDTTRA